MRYSSSDLQPFILDFRSVSVLRRDPLALLGRSHVIGAVADGEITVRQFCHAQFGILKAVVLIFLNQFRAVFFREQIETVIGDRNIRGGRRIPDLGNAVIKTQLEPSGKQLPYGMRDENTGFVQRLEV